jgi:hypothetical protein
MLQHIAIFLLGTAILFSATSVVITISHIISVLLDSTTAVQWGTQTTLVHGRANSTMILQWGPLRPILHRFHDWSDCRNWSAAQQWVYGICKIGFDEDYNGKRRNMLWECICLSGYQLSPDTKVFNEHYCKLEKRGEVAWTSLGSALVLMVLLALGGCIWRQKKGQRRIRGRERAIELQNRLLRHDGRVKDANSIKTARRVPVLPTIRASRNPSPGTDANPTTVGAKQRFGKSSGSHDAEVRPASIPMARRIV